MSAEHDHQRGRRTEAGSSPTQQRHVGSREVRKVEHETRTFRGLDYRYGGGWCHEAVAAQLSWGYPLLEANTTDAVHRRLCRALADLTNLAGWASFDAGLFGQAHARFDHALTLARRGGDEALAANVLYHKGRVYLHQDALPAAQHTFELGERAAIAAGSWHMRSVLCANQAWLYAKFGNAKLALATLGKAHDAFNHVETGAAAPWVRFFGETDLRAMSGTVHVELATRTDARHAATAVTDLSDVVRAYGCGMARSRALCLTMLATAHLVEGDSDRAAEVTGEALGLAQSLNSARFADRLRPLRQEARRRDGNIHAFEIARSLAVFETAA